MDRRTFLITSNAALFSSLLLAPIGKSLFAGTDMPDLKDWLPNNPVDQNGPAPIPEITAAVDVLVPPDPEIPDDFKGSDYGGDWVVAAVLGTLGMTAVAFFLNKYARLATGRTFVNCTPEEQLAAIKQWITDRETLPSKFNDMLTGLLTISMIGTFEGPEGDQQLEVFESMGWYDPKDPSGTFHVPCEGYVDSFQFPVRLKKGFANEK